MGLLAPTAGGRVPIHPQSIDRTSMPGRSSLTVVIPVYNEQEALERFLPQLASACARQGWRLILVDDGSTDGSGKILDRYARNRAVKIIHHKVNRGYGGALKSGIAHVETPYVVTMDGDGQHETSDVARIHGFAVESDADLVVGRRPAGTKRDWFRGLGKWIIRTFARFLMPLPIYDLNSGFKLYRTRLARKYMRICPDSMAFSDVITLTFVSQHHLVLELPITVHRRTTGKSTIRLSTAIDTLAEILGLALMFNPLRVFVPLSLLCVAAGVAWGLPLMLAGRGISVASMLAILLGALISIIGLVASQLSGLRIQMLADKDEDEE
jgi:hypothetical protein